MGYRSDVAYMVKFYHKDTPEKAFAEFVKFVDWVKNNHVARYHPSPRETIEDMEGYAENEDSWSYGDEVGRSRRQAVGGFYIHQAEQMISFHTEYVKWYENYHDVQWHEQLLGMLYTYETGNYRFIRIGEDYHDIEVKEHTPTCELHEKVDVVRSIEFHPPCESENKEAA
jgi:hypothetical protein